MPLRNVDGKYYRNYLRICRKEHKDSQKKRQMRNQTQGEEEKKVQLIVQIKISTKIEFCFQTDVLRK